MTAIASASGSTVSTVPSAVAPVASSAPAAIRHRTATVLGRQVFYREAGDPSLPTLLLLHGLPTSSRMFLPLIPLLADRFHVIAPDYIGFGHSDAPSPSEFTYTFDHLAEHVAGLVDALGLTAYTLYMQDYGGPIGYRLFTQRPHQVTGFIIQNANAYVEGVGDEAKTVFGPLWQSRTPATEAPARELISMAGTKWHWLVGVKDPELIDPDHWIVDQALLDRPGIQDANVDLLANYQTNLALYPTWHEAFRQHRPKTLIVWGKNDPIFIPPGARAYLNDLPDAKLVWLDGGHFVLDEFAPQVAAEIRAFFG
ncbi:alpha/beta fold hydrolase [Mitsuaria sp. GD03876]|uniref:alpha/beta fold hydrolase n=1 Tax=Mitsuaria sp. GD03876 TaxID=2975399 RepID=UPI00244C9A8A|nr:alpha/beta fold hydrolase [Mitsuaria sp. GD03876]MDH0865573.1 alpha/beta hydrolase [Mitsuaria sp. GD03876]